LRFENRATDPLPAPESSGWAPPRRARSGSACQGSFAGDGVVVEFLVACRRIPATAKADLVEAVAFLVLTEPLFLELVVTDEVRSRSGPRAPLVDDALALGELLLEVVAVERIEVVAVYGGIGPRVAVGRDDDVVLQRHTPDHWWPRVPACHNPGDPNPRSRRAA
jgi:hypothetical protein